MTVKRLRPQLLLFKVRHKTNLEETPRWGFTTGENHNNDSWELMVRKSNLGLQQVSDEVLRQVWLWQFLDSAFIGSQAWPAWYWGHDLSAVGGPRNLKVHRLYCTQLWSSLCDSGNSAASNSCLSLSVRMMEILRLL